MTYLIMVYYAVLHKSIIYKYNFVICNLKVILHFKNKFGEMVRKQNEKLEKWELTNSDFSL